MSMVAFLFEAQIVSVRTWKAPPDATDGCVLPHTTFGSVLALDNTSVV
jgi:hypothetical protein